MSERIRGSYDDALYKSTFTLLYFTFMFYSITSKAKWMTLQGFQGLGSFSSNFEALTLPLLSSKTVKNCQAWVTNSHSCTNNLLAGNVFDVIVNITVTVWRRSPVQVWCLSQPSCWAMTTVHLEWWIHHHWHHTCEMQLQVNNTATQRMQTTVQFRRLSHHLFSMLHKSVL